MIRTFVMLTLAVAAPSFLQTLKTDEGRARDPIFAAVTSGLGAASYCPGTCSGLSPSVRLEVTKQAAAFATAYLKSADFKQRYEKNWRESEPSAPETVEAQTQREDDNAKQRVLEEAKAEREFKEKAASEKDPAMQKIWRDALAAREEMKRQTSAPEYKKMIEQARAMQVESLKETYRRDQELYERAHAEWVATKDPKVLIRRRIDEFMSLSSSIDFKAKTKQLNGKTVFVDEGNESLPPQWKMLYRLGAEGTEVLRAAAKHLKNEL